jgi:hypothetical protein
MASNKTIIRRWLLFIMSPRELAMITNAIPEQPTESHQDTEYQSADRSAETLTLDDLEFSEFHRQFIDADFCSK